MRWLWLALVLGGCGRGPLWFFGDGDDGDAAAPVRCSRADFLFVVDDSPSMQVHQRRLIENFGVFIEGVERVVEAGADIHVGIVTTDAYYGNEPPCNVLGGLVTATVGANSSWSTCGPFAAGGNYMTDLDDLETAFACTAQVGTLGDDVERPIAAALAALDPSSPAATCNAGFARPNALLTVVLLTDERDSSGGRGDDLASQLAAIKGNERGVVVVTLAEDDDSRCGTDHDGPCFDSRLQNFTEWFEFGFLGSIDGDYAEHFDDAVALVESACADE